MRQDDTPFKGIIKRFEPGSELLRAWPLEGGVSAAVTALEVRQVDGETHKLIVRQHGEADRAHNPHIAADEFKLLGALQTAGIAAPEPYYVDESGTIFPLPYVVIAYIDGQPEFNPPDVDDFARQLAALLVRIHRLDPGALDLPPLPHRTRLMADILAHHPAKLDESLGEGRIRDVLERVWPLTPHNPTCLLHGDYWPGNAIWQAGQLQAVIDWEDAGLGDPLWDVAVMRLELLWTLGMEAMQTFTRMYTTMHPFDLTHLPYWDLCVALRPTNQISTWATDDAAKVRMREGHRVFVAQAFEKLNSM